MTAPPRAGRKREGTVEPRMWGGELYWYARVRTPDGRKPSVRLAPVAKMAKPAALALAHEQQRLVTSGEILLSPAVPASTPVAGETVAKYVDRWLEERSDRRLSSVAGDRLILDKFILPVLGSRPIATVARADVEAVVERLDCLIRARAGNPDAKDDKGRRVGIRSKTAWNVFGLVTKLFDDACSSKRLGGGKPFRDRRAVAKARPHADSRPLNKR